MENEEVGGLEGVLLGLEHEADFQEIPSESVAEGVNVIAKDYCSKLIEAALEVKDQRGGRKEDPLIPEDIIVASRKLKQGGLISNRIALGI
ncbi:MAG: hypothetical protein EZS28_008407 [Streblomastix strix]|uniref:Uncharacterized protein n=1 Tax=Streblomastix strix TaxID=222440 RepID=A0A5J4WN27_9EUKA|nr:MAG: hypothetical protein EZS28_008407 [Streblomastix strix]